MKAVVLPAFGQAERLELRDVAEPTPGPNEIKVRVVAAGINPVDWKLRSGALQAYMPIDLPAVLGRDVAGEVVAVGASVTRLRVGARVCGIVNHGYAEYVVAREDAWAEVPAKLDLVEAAALPLVLLTGSQLVEEAADVHAGETVLVTGATGSVGRVAVFAAKRRGATVYAGVRAAHPGFQITFVELQHRQAVGQQERREIDRQRNTLRPQFAGLGDGRSSHAVADKDDRAARCVDDARDMRGIAAEIDFLRGRFVATIAGQIDWDRIVSRGFQARNDRFPRPGALPGAVHEDEGETR